MGGGGDGVYVGPEGKPGFSEPPFLLYSYAPAGRAQASAGRAEQSSAKYAGIPSKLGREARVVRWWCYYSLIAVGGLGLVVPWNAYTG